MVKYHYQVMFGRVYPIWSTLCFLVSLLLCWALFAVFDIRAIGPTIQAMVSDFKSNQKLRLILISCALVLGGLTLTVSAFLLLVGICTVTLFLLPCEIMKLQFGIRRYVQHQIETNLKRRNKLQRVHILQSCRDMVPYRQFELLSNSVKKVTQNMNFEPIFSLLKASRSIKKGFDFMAYAFLIDAKTLVKLACLLVNERVNMEKIEVSQEPKEITVKKSMVAFMAASQIIEPYESYKSRKTIPKPHQEFVVSALMPIKRPAECKSLVHLAAQCNSLNQESENFAPMLLKISEDDQAFLGIPVQACKVSPFIAYPPKSDNFEHQKLICTSVQAHKVNTLVGLNQPCMLKNDADNEHRRNIQSTEAGRKKAAVPPFPVVTPYQSQVLTRISVQKCGVKTIVMQERVQIRGMGTNAEIARYGATRYKRSTSEEPSESSDQASKAFSDVIIASPGDLFLARKIENLDKELTELANQQNSASALISEKTRINDGLEAMIKVKSDLIVQIERLNRQKLQFESQVAQNVISPSNTKITVPAWVINSVAPRQYASYTILVQRIKEDGLPKTGWIVMRRYREFLALHENLNNLFPEFCGALDFPSRWQISSFSKVFLEARRTRFEEYLQALIENPEICKQQTFLKFLCKETD